MRCASCGDPVSDITTTVRRWRHAGIVPVDPDLWVANCWTCAHAREIGAIKKKRSCKVPAFRPRVSFPIPKPDRLRGEQ